MRSSSWTLETPSEREGSTEKVAGGSQVTPVAKVRG